ncbi:MAG: ABC transporter substrate-binding protein [Erysipelothrix sp.]|nr:ABC transporter substrate-binding protein [Erysipelothrix sp.]
MKKFVKYSIMALVALSLTACSASGGKDSDKVLLGVNYDLTGGGAQYGQAELEGTKLAVKLYNEKGGFKGESVELLTLDGKSDPQESYRAQTKLAEDGVFAIIGATISGTSSQAIKASGEMEVPTVSPSATADLVTNDGKKAYPYGYRVCYSDSFQAITMANFTVDKGFKKVGVIGDSSSEYAAGLSKEYIKVVEAAGVEVVVEEYYTEGDSDFSALLTKVKANADVEALFIPGYYSEVGPLLKQAHELGVNLPVLGVDGYDSSEFIDLASAPALNNVYYTNHYSTLIDSDVHTAFVEAFEKEYGKKPNGFAALAFDATNLVLEALERADSTDPKKVNDAIKNTVDFEAVTGVISIDDMHNAKKATYVVELKDGVEVNATIVNP